MNKSDLVDKVHEATHTTKTAAQAAVDAVFGEIEKALRKGDRVQLTGFGTFEVRDRKARTARNPQTGASIRVAATRVPAFKAGKALKDAVK